MFSKATKAIQARKGSRNAYAKVEARGGFHTDIDADLAAFIAAQRTAFLATASADGQPYVQHRGGPPGFLRVLDPHTIAFTEYRGNRQYISHGNLSENAKVMLFLIDYPTQQRVKIWGEAKVVEDDPAKPEGEIVIRVTAWDANCPQHIPDDIVVDSRDG